MLGLNRLNLMPVPWTLKPWRAVSASGLGGLCTAENPLTVADASHTIRQPKCPRTLSRKSADTCRPFSASSTSRASVMSWHSMSRQMPSSSSRSAGALSRTSGHDHVCVGSGAFTKDLTIRMSDPNMHLPARHRGPRLGDCGHTGQHGPGRVREVAGHEMAYWQALRMMKGPANCSLTRPSVWSGRRESNPRIQLGKLALCH